MPHHPGHPGMPPPAAALVSTPKTSRKLVFSFRGKLKLQTLYSPLPSIEHRRGNDVGWSSSCQGAFGAPPPQAGLDRLTEFLFFLDMVESRVGNLAFLRCSVYRFDCETNSRLPDLLGIFLFFNSHLDAGLSIMLQSCSWIRQTKPRWKTSKGLSSLGINEGNIAWDTCSWSKIEGCTCLKFGMVNGKAGWHRQHVRKTKNRSLLLPFTAKKGTFLDVPPWLLNCLKGSQKTAERPET